MAKIAQQDNAERSLARVDGCILTPDYLSREAGFGLIAQQANAPPADAERQAFVKVITVMRHIYMIDESFLKKQAAQTSRSKGR